MNSILHLKLFRIAFHLVLVLLPLVGCAPKFVYPTDPFEEENSVFLTHRSHMEAAIVALRDPNNTSTWKTKEQSAADTAIVRLANKQLHVPSLSLLGRYYLAYSDSFTAKGGWKGKYKKKFLSDAKRRKLSQKAYEHSFKEWREKAFSYLNLAAKFDYKPAIEVLKREGLPIPEKSLEPVAVLVAKRKHEIALMKYEISMESLGDSISQSIEGAGQYYAAKKYGSTGTSSSTVSSRSYENAYETNDRTLSAGDECRSDYGCDFGEKCVKATGKITGVCAKVVDSYGNKQNTLRNPSSLSTTKEQCEWNSDCPIGFRCDKSLGGINGGFCVK